MSTFYYLHQLPEHEQLKQLDTIERWNSEGFVLCVDGKFCFIIGRRL